MAVIVKEIFVQGSRNDVFDACAIVAQDVGFIYECFSSSGRITIMNIFPPWSISVSVIFLEQNRGCLVRIEEEEDSFNGTQQFLTKFKLLYELHSC